MTGISLKRLHLSQKVLEMIESDHVFCTPEKSRGVVTPRSPCVAWHNSGQSRSCWVGFLPWCSHVNPGGHFWLKALVPHLTFVCDCIYLAFLASLLPVPPTLVGGTQLVGSLEPTSWLVPTFLGWGTGELPGCAPLCCTNFCSAGPVLCVVGELWAADLRRP